MMGRAIAWCVVALFCGVLWHYGSQWRNPWGVGGGVASPVLSLLPAAAPGCGPDCK